MPIGRGSKGRGGKGRKSARAGRSDGFQRVIKRRQLNQRRARQAQRAAARAQAPLPRPGPRPGFPPVLPTPRPAQGENLLARFQSLQQEFTRLDRDSNLETLYRELGRIEEIFTQLPARLDELRARGYVHSGHLEDRLEALDEEWDHTVRPNVERQLNESLGRLDREMALIQQALARLRTPNEAALSQVENALGNAQRSINAVQGSVGSLFQGTLAGLGEVQHEVHRAEWMVEHIGQSRDIRLLPAEGPLLAVEAEWEQDGEEDGPDGILYLTDQRLLFEQKEEVATKKFLFITTDSEIVQKLLLEIPVREIEEIEHGEEKRGLLNLRKDDILELVMTAAAPVSRARFHIRGQESAEWAAMLKRVQTGDIDDDRAEDYLSEVEEASAATAALPERCPYCMAAVPPQPRGVTSVVCEFCHSTITAGP